MQFNYIQTVGFLNKIVATSSREVVRPKIDIALKNFLVSAGHNITLHYKFPTINFSSYYRRIRRGDHEVNVPYIPSPVYNIVSSILYEVWCDNRILDIDEFSLPLDSSAGLPFRGKKKSELLRCVDFFQDTPELHYYTTASPKTNELLDEKVILVKGPRIIFVTCFHLIIKQKKLFEDQNKKFCERMKPYGVVIGISSKNGEWHDLISKHVCFTIHVTGDSLTQDLNNAYMQPVYDIRSKCLKMAVKGGTILFDIDVECERLINPRIVLINGQVITFPNLAISGSNNITIDNTIAYLFLIYTVFFNVFGDTWLSYVRESEISIYSDDWIVSTNCGELESPDVWHYAWNNSGMVLKTLTITRNILEIEFLGSKVIKREYFNQDWYCQVPLRQRVLTSIVVVPRDLTLQEKFDRLLNFCNLFLHHSIFTSLYTYTYEFAQKFNLRCPTRFELLANNLGIQGGL